MNDDDDIDVDVDIVVEASGCLSECDKGPNVELTTTKSIGGEKTLLHGMVDAQTCAFQLGEAASNPSCSFPQIPKILVAASKVMEQSERFSANGQFEEAIRFLTSVIDKLEVSPVLVSPSTAANAHAHALRAQARLQLATTTAAAAEGGHGETTSAVVVVEACISDAQRVVRDFSKVATTKSLALAYRTWTDAELYLAQQNQQQQQQQQQQQEAKTTETPKDVGRVVAVLQEWYRKQPMYRTKLQGEIQGLLMKNA